ALSLAEQQRRTRSARGRARSAPCTAAPHMLPSTLITGSAPAMLKFSWLNPTPHTIAVYASPSPSPATTQYSLTGGRYPPLPAPVFHRLDRASFALAHIQSFQASAAPFSGNSHFAPEGLSCRPGRQERPGPNISTDLPLSAYSDPGARTLARSLGWAGGSGPKKRRNRTLSFIVQSSIEQKAEYASRLVKKLSVFLNVSQEYPLPR